MRFTTFHLRSTMFELSRDGRNVLKTIRASRRCCAACWLIPCWPRLGCLSRLFALLQSWCLESTILTVCKAVATCLATIGLNFRAPRPLRRVMTHGPTLLLRDRLLLVTPTCLHRLHHHSLLLTATARRQPTSFLQLLPQPHNRYVTESSSTIISIHDVAILNCSIASETSRF